LILSFFFVYEKKLSINLVPYLALEILLWKLLMEQSFTYENVVMGNNETIEIYMNDDFLEENVSV